MKPIRNDWAVDFLPDADALERRRLPAGFTATLYLLVGLVAAAVLWASLCELDIVVTARGRLVTQTPGLAWVITDNLRLGLVYAVVLEAFKLGS